jgi:outer membrane biosynthesis protein TonB
MPSTEVPTSPPGRPPEPFSRRKRVRYEELEPDELLHLIDRLEDERSRALRREGIWISVIAHLILFWFLFYGPRAHRVHVVNPDANKQKDMTFLNLPPDAQRPVKPPKQAPPSDKDRMAQSRHPTLDKKTLQQLEAMRKAGPPIPTAPQPAPQQAAPPSPAPEPQQQAQARPATPPPTNQPLLNEPKPVPTPTKPSFDTGAQNAGEAIRQAERNAARGPAGPSDDYGLNAPSQHPAMQAGVDVLSDTMGVDFGPYLKRLIADTYRSWLPLIPESARPPLDKQGRVGIRFKIAPDGSVKEMVLEFPSGDVSLDKAAWGGIKFAGYPPLPKDFKGPFLELRFGFYYNSDPDKIR